MGEGDGGRGRKKRVGERVGGNSALFRMPGLEKKPYVPLDCCRTEDLSIDPEILGLQLRPR